MSRTATLIAAIALAGLNCALQAADSPTTNSLNRVNFTAKVGFGVTAKFTSGSTLPLSGSSRTTAHGDRFNYDDGYVLTDASGNAGGQTWYWGYDRASQVVGNTIALTRSSIQGNNSDLAIGSDSDLQFGGELSFSRELGVRGEVHFGAQAALTYLNINLHSSFDSQASLVQTTDSYAFIPGTTPPLAPYQGSFGGPGFLLSSTPSGSVSTTVPGAAIVSGDNKLTANLYGVRLGPSVEFPVFDVLQMSLGGGFAAGWLDASASWNADITLPQGGSASASGSGSASSFVFGGYLFGELGYQISSSWSVAAGVQYQNLGTYQHSFNGRMLELDLSKTLFVTLSAGFSF